jgi:hypothetical protein
MPIAIAPPLKPLLEPLFAELPLARAMRRLVAASPLGGKPAQLVEAAVADPKMAGRPELCAGLWLYVDDLDRSHALSQSILTPTGSFWHAIMHRREGDFDNAKYWYRKAGRHPAMNHIDLTGGGAGSGTDVARYDPYLLVDRAAAAMQRGDDSPPALISEQHREWKALFGWCMAQ